MRRMLENHGFETEGATDGAEGIRKAREIRPDLILMDIVMPGVDGFRATRTLANDPATRKIPVIMVSSKSQETDRIWGMRQGAVDYRSSWRRRRLRCLQAEGCRPSRP